MRPFQKLASFLILAACGCGTPSGSPGGGPSAGPTSVEASKTAAYGVENAKDLLDPTARVLTVMGFTVGAKDSRKGAAYVEGSRPDCSARADISEQKGAHSSVYVRLVSTPGAPLSPSEAADLRSKLDSLVSDFHRSLEIALKGAAITPPTPQPSSTPSAPVAGRKAPEMTGAGGGAGFFLKKTEFKQTYEAAIKVAGLWNLTVQNSNAEGDVERWITAAAGDIVLQVKFADKPGDGYDFMTDVRTTRKVVNKEAWALSEEFTRKAEFFNSDVWFATGRKLRLVISRHINYSSLHGDLVEAVKKILTDLKYNPTPVTQGATTTVAGSLGDAYCNVNVLEIEKGKTVDISVTSGLNKDIALEERMAAREKLLGVETELFAQLDKLHKRRK